MVIMNLWEMNINCVKLHPKPTYPWKVEARAWILEMCATLTLRSGQTLMLWTTIMLGIVPISITAYQTANITQTRIWTQIFPVSRNALPLNYLDVLCLIAKTDKNFDFIYNKMCTMTLTLALGLSYDTPFGHGQKLCEASSASKLAEFE